MNPARDLPAGLFHQPLPADLTQVQNDPNQSIQKIAAPAPPLDPTPRPISIPMIVATNRPRVITICRFDGISFKRNSQEMRVLSIFEQQQLLSVLFEDFDRYKLGVFICLYTGIRIGELCALQWKDISFSEKAIVIEHTMQRLQNDDPNAIYKTRIIITEPKSKASLRTIPLPDFVVKAIKPFVSSPNAYILSLIHI